MQRYKTLKRAISASLSNEVEAGLGWKRNQSSKAISIDAVINNRLFAPRRQPCVGGGVWEKLENQASTNPVFYPSSGRPEQLSKELA